MKRFLNPANLPLLTMGAGGLGLVLRIWYFASRDDKGLLATPHFADTLCYLLFAAALAAIFLCARQLRNGTRYQRFFHGGLVSAVGHGIGAAGILISCITELVQKVPMAGISFVLGILAAASMALLGLMRFQKQRPSLYLYVILAVYFVIHTLLQVRQWNKESQVSVIFFPLLASLFLMICTYLHAQLTVKQEGVPIFVMSQQATLLLCLLSINATTPVFYLTMAAWLGCDGWSVPKKQPVVEDV